MHKPAVVVHQHRGVVQAFGLPQMYGSTRGVGILVVLKVFLFFFERGWLNILGLEGSRNLVVLRCFC